MATKKTEQAAEAAPEPVPASPARVHVVTEYDKNGAGNTVISGTLGEPPNTPIVIAIGERVFSGGLVDGEAEFRAVVPAFEGPFEIRRNAKNDAEVLASGVA